MHKPENLLDAVDRGVKLWQIAELCGMSDSDFCRKLLEGFSPEEKQKVLKMSNKIAEEIENIENENY